MQLPSLLEAIALTLVAIAGIDSHWAKNAIRPKHTKKPKVSDNEKLNGT